MHLLLKPGTPDGEVLHAQKSRNLMNGAANPMLSSYFPPHIINILSLANASVEVIQQKCCHSEKLYQGHPEAHSHK